MPPWGPKTSIGSFCKCSHLIVDTMKEQAQQLSKTIVLTDCILVVNSVHRSYIPQGQGRHAQFLRPSLTGAKRGWARDYLFGMTMMLLFNNQKEYIDYSL